MRLQIVTALVIVLSIHQNAFSQEEYLAIKGGGNLSKLKSETISDIKVNDRYTYNMALAYSVELNNWLGLSFEPGYIQKGARIEDDSLDYKFHYANMPVLLDFYPIEKLKISVGPEISYLLKARNQVSDTISVNILDTYNKRWEISGTVGVSYSVAFFADLGIRYSTSFSKVSAYDAALDRRKLYNQYLQLFLLIKIAN